MGKSASALKRRLTSSHYEPIRALGTAPILHQHESDRAARPLGRVTATVAARCFDLDQCRRGAADIFK
jgi:hypothetical protein